MCISLKHTINSIFNQDYTNSELIIIDEGSDRIMFIKIA